METRKKPFDCVEFKRQAQRRLMEEFEARRDEFATYADFINAKVKEDPKAIAMRRHFGFK
ncbi:MAG TPA: hypothetical protein VMZ92_11625 [Planctomycetota bacterium]|nr:hypothetical protein [Planctomycetota bacterium]